jgi:threonine/homoserine/homoserine lactone efflux protein
MIPPLYYPAAQHSWHDMLLLIIIYTLVTLLTMIAMVLIGFYGLHFLKTEKLEKYMHPLGGLALLVCGVGVVFMNW